MKHTPIIIICILLVLLLAESVFAMASPAYRIDWNNLLSGSGGPVSSPGYQMNFTVGQTVRGAATSPQFQVQLGYWAGSPAFSIFLPKVEKKP